MPCLPSGPSDARLMIVSECVSYRDLQSSTILNDREFDRMLEEAGVARSRCFVTSLIREPVHGQSFETQVPQTKALVTPRHRQLHNRSVDPSVIAGLASLERDIDLVKPKIILAIGNGALFALTGKWGIKSWRSSILEYTSPGGHHCHVIATYPPSYIYSQWKDRNTCVFDIRKSWALATDESPIKTPQYDFTIEPTFPQVLTRLTALLRECDAGPRRLSVDIETRSGHIACTGIAWSKTEALCIPHLRAVVSETPAWETRIHYWRQEEEAFILHLLYRLSLIHI